MSDLPGLIYTQYKRALKKAGEAANRGNSAEAATAYQHCAQHMRQYAEYAPDGKTRQKRLDQATEFEQIAKQIKSGISGTGRLASAGRPTSTQAESTVGEDDYEGQVMSLIQKTDIKWDDIAGLDKTIKAIKTAIGMALARRPKGVVLEPVTNFLLFGPPGTGKTMLAAAAAGSFDNLNVTFFNVKVSSLLSKYYGESTKLITALFTVARRMSPAVVFLDEFDSLTPMRGLGESSADNKIVSTFLSELEGLDKYGTNNFILTIGATNLPWNLDTAIISRFKQRIYVPLPNAVERKAILGLNLAPKGHESSVKLVELIRRTNGFSGREIEQLCQLAIANMVERMNIELSSKVDQGRAAVSDYEINIDVLKREDFDIAFEQVNPVTTPEMVREYESWIAKAKAR